MELAELVCFDFLPFCLFHSCVCQSLSIPLSPFPCHVGLHLPSPPILPHKTRKSMTAYFSSNFVLRSDFSALRCIAVSITQLFSYGRRLVIVICTGPHFDLVFGLIYTFSISEMFVFLISTDLSLNAFYRR